MQERILTRRQALLVLADAAGTLLLNGCGKQNTTASNEASSPLLTPDQRVAAANLAEFVPLYNKISAFKERYGVDIPAFRKIGATLQSVIDGTTTFLDNSYINRLGNRWGTNVQAAGNVVVSADLRSLPQDNQNRGLEFLQRIYQLMPAMRPISPRVIRVMPDSDSVCGSGTGGCTDGMTITMDNVTDTANNFYFVFLHEIGHDLDAKLADNLEYYFKDQFITHYNDYADFYAEVAALMETSTLDTLIDYGVNGRKTQEVTLDDNNVPEGDVGKTYVNCYQALSPIITYTDIPVDPSSNPNDPKEIALQFDKRRLPLFKRALAAFANNETINGIPARNIQAIKEYIEASFRYIRHISIDPVFEETTNETNILGQMMFYWRKILQGSRLQLLSHGAIPADTPIDGIRAALAM